MFETREYLRCYGGPWDGREVEVRPDEEVVQIHGRGVYVRRRLDDIVEIEGRRDDPLRRLLPDGLKWARDPSRVGYAPAPRVALAPRGPKTKRNAEVVRLREAGLTFAEIAARFGITRQRAHLIYRTWRAARQQGRSDKSHA